MSDRGPGNILADGKAMPTPIGGGESFNKINLPFDNEFDDESEAYGFDRRFS